MKKVFLIILNIILSLLALFCLLGGILMLATPVDGNIEISGGIFFIIIAILFAFFPIKNLFKFGINNDKREKDEIQKMKEYEEKRGIKHIAQDVAIIEKENIIILNKKEYAFNDILNYDLLEDGKTITTTIGKKKASLGKAMIGGALFGGAGAIVGGSSGKINSTSTEDNYCTKLDIKITLSNLSTPCEIIHLISSGVNRESRIYHQKYDDAQKIISLLNVIISKR